MAQKHILLLLYPAVMENIKLIFQIWCILHLNIFFLPRISPKKMENYFTLMNRRMMVKYLNSIYCKLIIDLKLWSFYCTLYFAFIFVEEINETEEPKLETLPGNCDVDIKKKYVIETTPVEEISIKNYHNIFSSSVGSKVRFLKNYFSYCFCISSLIYT